MMVRYNRHPDSIDHRQEDAGDQDEAIATQLVA